MSSFRQIYYHVIFGTKCRRPSISERHCDELYAYITGIIKSRRCKPLIVNGVEDHIHILSDLHPCTALADYVKEIKVAASIWMKGSARFPGFTGWQDGYGAFTYSMNERDRVYEYVSNQKEHHKNENSYDEYKRILLENGIEFDERYLL
jgi:REP element-mobilizing transposase RayT